MRSAGRYLALTALLCAAVLSMPHRSTAATAPPSLPALQEYAAPSVVDAAPVARVSTTAIAAMPVTGASSFAVSTATVRPVPIAGSSAAAFRLLHTSAIAGAAPESLSLTLIVRRFAVHVSNTRLASTVTSPGPSHFAAPRPEG